MDGLKARLSFDAVAYDYDDEYLTIDTDTHTININNVSRLFGVQYDGNSKLIKFRIRNKLSDIQKMQDSIVYINWIDSKGVKGQSIAINKTISNDTCEFAWKVPFDALKNSGVLHFAVSAVVTKNSSSVIDQKWSTQIASVITPDGIYIKSYTPSSEEEDRIAQIYNELAKMINKQNDNLQSQVNSLNKDLDNLDVYLPNLGIGALSNDYPFSFSSNFKYRVSTKNKITFTEDTIFKIKDGFNIGVRYDFDDINKTSKDTGWINGYYYFEKNKEYLVSIRRKLENTSEILTEIDEFKYAVHSLPLKTKDVLNGLLQIDFSRLFSVFLGHITSNKYDEGKTTTRAISNIFKYNGKIIVLDKTGTYKMANAEWNLNDDEHTTDCIWDGWKENKMIVDCKEGKKYCFHFGRIDDNTININDLLNSFVISFAITNENQQIVNEIINISDIVNSVNNKISNISDIVNSANNKKYSECYYFEQHPEMYIEQDCTNLETEYLFAGASNEKDTSVFNGKLFLMSKELKKIKELTHNLGHCASVDYSRVSHSIIFANGSTDKTIRARLDILPNAKETLNNNTVLSLSDVISIELNSEWYGLTACFGGSADTCYIMYFTDKTGNNCNIAQCKLGLGNVDLSNNGYGTFIQGKENSEYNGTLKVIKTFNPIYLNALQGAEYHNGKIWLMSSNDKVRAYQLQLTEDNNVIIENCYGFDQLNTDGTNVIYESEGMMHIDEHTLLTSIFTNQTPKTIILEV